MEEDYKKMFVGTSVAALLFTYLGAGERLKLTEPTRRDDYSKNAPTKPLQLLEFDDGAEEKVGRIFEKTFDMKLVLNRLAGEDLCLNVYDKRTERPLSGGRRREAQWLASLPMLHRQGDGVRSFTGTLLSLLVNPKSMILIDEPEAFLHPPQARKLASVIAADTAGSQVFIATHSDEIVRSLLDTAGDRVIVLRVDRHVNRNKVSVLDSAGIEHLWVDPLLRTSDVLSALFHEGAIICEGDSDARFLRAILEATETEFRDRDFRFFHFWKGSNRERRKGAAGH